MPKLVIENGPDRGLSFIIRQEGPFFAGRDVAAQVPIRDEMASRRHFQIEIHDGVFHLRDLGSSNGTSLNGKSVKRLEALAPNDRIQVGSTLLTFLDDKPHPLIGKEIAGYRILDRVGRGGMGTVYRALQTSLDRIVALKILAPHLVTNTSFVNLFIREARAAGALSHPNIVQVYDVGVQDDVYFFSMEYIPDGSVEDILNKSGVIPLARALRIVRDSALGLQYAERKGIIHRDIKPGNLMVGAGGVIKIGDLGIARSTDGEGLASQKDGVSGSPHYIAPEQARGLDIDHRVDLYSLGVSFYQMLCGQTPFRGSTPREVILKHIKEDPPPLSDQVENLPDDVTQVVKRMMEKDPNRRTPAATDLLREIEPLLVQYPDDGSQTPDPSTKLGRKLTVALTGFVLLTAVSWWVFRLSEHWAETQQQRAELLRGYSLTLDTLEEYVANRQQTEAAALMQEVMNLDLPADLIHRRERCRNSLLLLRDEISRENREREAERTLVDLIAGLAVDPDPADVERLREFATSYADTRSAAPALVRADGIEQTIIAGQKLEEEARIRLKGIQATAEGYSSHGQYARAREELAKFPAKYEQTSAANDLRGFEDQLRRNAEQEWETLRHKIDERVERDEFWSAQTYVADFEGRAGFPELVEKVKVKAGQVREAKEAHLAATNSGADEDRRALGPILTKSWKSWAASLAAKEALQVIDDNRFRLPSHLKAKLDQLRAFLIAWDRVFDGLTATPPPMGRITIDLLKGSEESVEVVRIHKDLGLIFKKEGRSGEQWYRWNEMTPASRADVILRWARTPEELVYAGFLASLCGREHAAEAAWSSAQEQDPELASTVDVLKSLLGFGTVESVEGND